MGQIWIKLGKSVGTSGRLIVLRFNRHSLSVTPFPIICHFVCPFVLLSVCPAIIAYISVTISWILMKLGESVGT